MVMVAGITKKTSEGYNNHTLLSAHAYTHTQAQKHTRKSTYIYMNRTIKMKHKT